MAFKIGKFFGRLAGGAIKAVPQIIAGYATGGPAGAALAGLSSVKTGTPPGAAPVGALAALGRPIGAAPAGFAPYGMPAYGIGAGSEMVLPVRAQQELVPLDTIVFNAIQKLLGALRIPYLPARMTAVARRVLAALLIFARRHPALSIVSMLVSFGLTADESYRLMAWFSVKKRRRRMNSGNSKALRRALRRVESFHRLCSRVGVARRTVGRRAARYCKRCRRSPCICV